MTENVLPDFAAWLVAARGEAGLTQDELAAETGVHVNTIKNLEKGKTRRPSAQVAAALRSRLGEQPSVEDVREGYDRHTQSVLDLIGAYLMRLPSDERLDEIFDLTRYVLRPKKR